MTKVAIIPARGGSKRVPGKNTRDFHGKPMLAWSIEAAKECGLFDHIIVSTESDEVAEVARAWGAEVPFCRPLELADDFTGTRAVIIHAIEELTKRELRADYVCSIYATAPLLQASDLRRGFDTLQATGADFAYSIAAFPAPIQRALSLTPKGRVQMVEPKYRLARSQDLEPAYFDAAQFYWGKAEAFMDRDKQMHSDGSSGIVLPSHRVVDIDTEEDWHHASLIFQSFRSQQTPIISPNPTL
jgi:pseudaminic acid cytidylyltransferase